MSDGKYVKVKAPGSLRSPGLVLSAIMAGSGQQVPGPAPPHPIGGPLMDDKEEPKSTSLSDVARLRASGGLKLKKLRSKFAVAPTNISGSTATVISTVVSVSAGNVSEWSSLQALYDEVKVLGGQLHFKIMRSAGSTSSTLPVCGTVSYDPMNSAALAGLEVAYTHTQHMEFGVPQSAAGITATLPGDPCMPVPVNRNGMYCFKFKCPEGGAQRNVGATDVCTGTWVDTVQTTADWGFLKFYVDAGPAGESYAIRYVLVLDMELRSRS